MPLSTAYPVMKAGIITELTPEIAKISEKAFKDAMVKFKEVSSKQVGNSGKDVFTEAVNAASLVFSKEMIKLSESIGNVVADQVNIYTLQSTITVPPGAVTLAASAAGPVTGAVTTPTIATIS